MTGPTANQVLDAAQRAGILPADAVITPRKAAARWRARGLDHTAFITRNTWWDQIDVVVHVLDPVFGRPFKAGGTHASITVLPAGCDIAPTEVQRTQFHEFAEGVRKSLKEVPALMERDAWHWEHRLQRAWPASRPGPEDMDFLEATLGAASTFVEDRADLCALLMREDEVHRGSLWVRQGQLPPRVITALLIARDLDDPDLEAAALEVLRSDRQVPVVGEADEPMRVAAARWLKDIRRLSGREIAI